MNVTIKYTSQNLAIIVPTKDRPEKLKTFLESLMVQSVRCSRIIIVASGVNVEKVVKGFSGSLPVEYYHIDPPGQIRQRNYAIYLLNESTPLVAFFDDDIVLEPGALANMLIFWNRCGDKTAGVSFNIVNAPPYRSSAIKNKLGLSDPEQGRILKSGFNTSILSVPESLRVQWLCGGATVWRQDILKEYLYKEIDAPWATCEDLIFSYPIGKKYPLFVCAEARVQHEHVRDHYSHRTKNIIYGRTEALWRLYFVSSNNDLSKGLFFWNLLMVIVERLFSGFFRLDPDTVFYGLGQLNGGLLGIYGLLRGKDLRMLIDQ